MYIYLIYSYYLSLSLSLPIYIYIYIYIYICWHSWHYVCLLFPSFNHTFHYSRCSSHCSFPHFLSLLGGDRWAVIRGVHRHWRHGMLSVPAVPGQLSTWSSTHHRAEWHSQQRPGKSVGITCCRIVFVCAYYNIYIYYLFIYIYLFTI